MANNNYLRDSNYSRAAGYYSKYSDANTIRKIQNFLSARGYYEGDLDGKFGPQIYAAIRKYQQKYGLKDDGMWGEATNSVHRVLNATNAPYRNDASGKSGAHTKQMTGVNTGNKDAMTEQEKYAYINNVITPEFYADPDSNSKFSSRYDSLWGDSDEAAKRREILRSYGAAGEAMLMNFYNDTDAQTRKTINPRYLPAQALAAKRKADEQNYIQNVTNAISEFPGKAATAVGSSIVHMPENLAKGYFHGNVLSPTGWLIRSELARKNRDERAAQAALNREGGVLGNIQYSSLLPIHRTGSKLIPRKRY